LTVRREKVAASSFAVSHPVAAPKVTQPPAALRLASKNFAAPEGGLVSNSRCCRSADEVRLRKIHFLTLIPKVRQTTSPERIRTDWCAGGREPCDGPQFWFRKTRNTVHATPSWTAKKVPSESKPSHGTYTYTASRRCDVISTTRSTGPVGVAQPSSQSRLKGPSTQSAHLNWSPRSSSNV